MNDIFKQNIKEKLETALNKEVLTNLHAAELLDISNSQVSYIRNPKLWPNLGPVPWEKVLAWVNSGQSIREYSQKHGRVVPETVKTVPKPQETVSEPPPIVPEAIQIAAKQAERKVIEEIRSEMNKMPLVKMPQSQKVTIDIEINIVVNGVRIKLA